MTFSEGLARLQQLFRGKEKSKEIAEELRFHIEQQTQENIRAGMPAEEARRQAFLKFGSAEQMREQCWQESRFISADHIWQDVAFAWRGMRKRPAFSAVAIGILALGLGANTAIFAIAKSLLLDQLPFRNPEQIVTIREATDTDEGFTMSPPNFDEYSRWQRTFEQLSFWVDQSVNLTGGDKPERVVGSFVSANFFEMLGVKAELGRLFAEGEDKPGAPKRVVLSHHTWATRFGSATDVLRRTLTLNGDNYEVIGVLPQNFEGLLSDDDVYLPIASYPNFRQDRAARAQLAFGRLRDGVSLQQGAADLNVVAQQIARDFPQFSRGIHIELTPVADMRTEGVRRMLQLLLISVGLVLIL